MRPTTLRDARKLGLFPSVTGIIRCAAAPGLERWKLDQMLHAALTLPRNDAEAEADWIARVWQDSQETAKKASERGTRIHAAIQGGFEGAPVHDEFRPHCQAVCAALFDWNGLPDYAWEPERSFACTMGYGGKADLSAPVPMEPGYVCDIKTTEKPLESLRTWDEHAYQLAAYRNGLGLLKARCAIVYVRVTGEARLIEIPEDDLVRGWDCFRALLTFWQAKNRYWSQMKVAA